MRAVAPLALALLPLLPLACAPAPRDPDPAPPAPVPANPEAAAAPPPAPSCARRAAVPAPAALDATGAGSGVALAGLFGRTLAFVADEEDAAIHTVDLDSRAALARTPLAGRPAQVIVMGDGRVVASLRDRGLLEVLEPTDAAAPLERRCLVPVASEPVGLALTPDRATLLVASRWGHALTAFAARDLARLGEAPLPRDPHAVIASADGQRALVSHAVGGRVSVVALAEGGAPGEARALDTAGVEWRAQRSMFPPRHEFDLDLESIKPAPKRHKRPMTRVDRVGSQGFALVRAASGAVFAPGVLVDPGPPAGSGGGGYGSADASTVVGQIAVIDPKGERAETSPASAALGIRDCLLPRAAALEPGSDVLLVACLGSDEIIAYDARPPQPGQGPQSMLGNLPGHTPAALVRNRELFRRKVGAGPAAIAVDAARGRAVVFSQFDGALTLMPAGRDAGPLNAGVFSNELTGELPVIALPRAARMDEQRALGRSLFHAASGRRIAFDGRACASCHPDGRDDGLTWSTPEGPRQTPMLMGRLDGTAPYGWEGDKRDLPGHFARTMSRLAGTGLSAAERDAIFAYVRGLQAPREAADLSADERAALVAPAAGDAAEGGLRARGEALFHAGEVGCSSCHLGDELTTDGARHDVRSATRFEAVRAFETPSLRFLGRSAPYYHDGRYPTLLALLESVDGSMGHTAQLSPDDRRALAAYLESL